MTMMVVAYMRLVLIRVKRVIKRNCGSYPHPQPIYTYSSSFVITLINLLFIMSVEFCCCVECRVQG